MAERSEIEARARRVISEALCMSVDDVMLDSDLKGDLNADSLDLFDLVIDLEIEFAIEVADVEIEKIRTVADAVALIEMKTAAG